MNIKNYRTKKKLTQVEFAEKLGIAQGTVSKAESGNTDACFRILVQMRLVFGFNVNKYLDENFKE